MSIPTTYPTGLGGRIRTCGPLRPRQVRYQTSPHLDNGFRTTRVPSTLANVSRRMLGVLIGDLGEAQTRFSS